MSSGDVVLNIGHLTGLGGMSPNEDSISPTQRPGTYTLLIDALGFRIFKYVRCIVAGTKGLTMQSTGDSLTPYFAVTNQTGTFTTKAITTGLTVNDHQGKLIYVQDDAGAAGALPEGEFSVVASNTETDIIFEPELPLSVALASGDDLSMIATYQAEVGTSGVLAAHCQGTIIANSGVSAGNYGWVQVHGVTYYVNVGTPTQTIDHPLKLASTGTLDRGSNTYVQSQLNVGRGITVVTDDQATPRGLMMSGLFHVQSATTS